MDRRLSYARGMLAAPSPDGALVFTASAEGLNRYGFSLNPKRWKIDNFNNNPVILWMHMDHMPPIGRGRSSLDAGGLKTEITFDRQDPFAVTIENKYRTGFLNAVSVGFDFVDKAGAPIDRWWAMDAEQMSEAYYDLAEVSAVPVPADPNALIRQRHALAADFGLNTPDTVEEAIKLLGYPTATLAALRSAQDRKDPPQPLVLPGNSELEKDLAKTKSMEDRMTGVENRMSAMEKRIDAMKQSAPTQQDEDYDPQITQDFLSAIKL